MSIDLAPHLPPENLESTKTWTLIETSTGFDVRIHVASTTRERLLRTALVVTSLVLLAFFVIDVAELHSFRASALFGGMAVGISNAWVGLRMLWTQDERLRVGPLSRHDPAALHTYVGPRGRRSDSMPLGPIVEVEVLRPARGWAALNLLIRASGARPAAVLHTSGRTLRVGYGLSVPDATRLCDALRERLGPDRMPVPGRPGAVHTVGRRVRTGLQIDGPPDKRRLASALNAEEGPVAPFGLSLLALVFGGVWALLHGVAESPLSASIALLGLIGSIAWLPGRGLIDRFRARETSRRRELGPDQPWTWRARWKEGREVRRSSTSSGFIVLVGALAALVGVLVTAGPPAHAVLAPVWLAFLVVIVGPLALQLWQRAFAGATEVRPATLPLATASRVEIRFAVSHDGAGFDDIAFRLLRTELVRSPQLLVSAYFWTTHEGVYRLPADQPPPGPSEEVAAVFDLPPDAGPTDDDSEPRVRWYLEVRGQRAAGAYLETFEVPVFTV